MLTPFFLISHAVSKYQGLPSYGYNSTYYFGIACAAWFYLLLALIFLSRTLRAIGVNDYAVALTILGISLGTNLFYYSSIDVGMSHVYGFFLFSLGLYLTVKWHEGFRRRHLVLLGFTLGLMTIVRPTNIIFMLFPLLYGVKSLSSFKEKMNVIWRHNNQLLLAIGAFAMVVFVQLLIWKIGTGKWVVYSYDGERFFFDRPRFWKGLFSYRKGWFVYSPILLIALVGIVFFFKRNKNILLPFMATTFVLLYVTLSWWCWWYGGSLGMRSLIELSAIFALPLGLLFDRLSTKFLFVVPLLLVILVVKLNFRFTESFVQGHLHYDSMTKEAYWKIAKKESLDESYWSLLSRPSAYNASLGNDESQPYARNLFKSSSVYVDSLSEFSESFVHLSRDGYFIEKLDTDLLIETECMVTKPVQDSECGLVVSLYNYDEEINYNYEIQVLDSIHQVPGQWCRVTMQVPFSYVFDEKADLKVYMWNPKNNEIHLRNIKITQLVY